MITAKQSPSNKTIDFSQWGKDLRGNCAPMQNNEFPADEVDFSNPATRGHMIEVTRTLKEHINSDHSL